MADQPARMWRYWRDKHGIVDALDYYPNKLAATPALQMAIHTIRANEALIELIMGEMPDEEEDNG